MDKFLSKTKCDRCGGSLEGGRIMSKFNTDCLCLKCKEAERKLPEYEAASLAELEAVREDYKHNRPCNFPGIGYPKK